MSFLLSFLRDNLPGARALALGGPFGLAWAYICLWFAGRLKRTRNLPTGYSRKIFHILIFGTVSGLQWQRGLPAVCLFGAATSLVVFYAVARGNGHPLYEAIAREQDLPHRTYFILAPYVATLLGGIAGNLLFGHAALFGYLVAGLGDAIGEPVGVRFGRHPYIVPSLRGVAAIRTWEGSASVFLACLAALALGTAMSPSLHFTLRTCLHLPLIALACALVEAVSPHGWDNASMQLIPAFLASVLL